MRDWPPQLDADVETWAGSVGKVERRFGDRLDSRTTILGVVMADGERYIFKAARDPEAVGWLQSAARFHRAVQHPAIPTVVAQIALADGLLLVENWAPGEVLVDGYDSAVATRDDPVSAYARFRSLSPDALYAAIGVLIDAHVAVADAGFVAVDLYDGCVMYEFETHQLSLIDLDHYQPGPYTLEFDRQLGSSSYMPPEEFQRGATIDERATVFTIGRMALTYLGCDRTRPNMNDFRGTPEQRTVALRAASPDVAARFTNVRELRTAWLEAG